MFGLVVLLAGVIAVQGQTTNVQRCTNTAAQGADLPLNVYIEGCIEPRCGLAQGTDAVVHMTFRAPRTMRRMTTHAQASVLFITLDHELEEHAETCNYLTNSFCPVLEGEILQYTLRMPILSIWPVGIAPTVEFRVEDENNVPIFCIRAPIVVTASRQLN